MHFVFYKISQTRRQEILEQFITPKIRTRKIIKPPKIPLLLGIFGGFTFILRKGNCIKDGVQIDDGYSGVDFDRPSVKRLIEDAENEKINLIICKDLSRFARNYVLLGQYIDYVFPLNNIRFIALSEKTAF